LLTFSRNLPYGKTGAAVKLIFAVSHRTVKKLLSCTPEKTHGKEQKRDIKKA
jgi:hypothetical protein